MGIEIRPWRATEAEARAIQRVMIRCHPHRPRRPPEAALSELKRRVKVPGSPLWVGALDGEVVAFGWVQRLEALPDARGLLGVDERARARGIGGALLDKLIAAAEACGPLRVSCQTWTSVPAGGRLLQKAGFTPWERIHLSRWSQESGVPDWARAKHRGVLDGGVAVVKLAQFQALNPDWREVWWRFEERAVADIPTTHPMPALQRDQWARNMSSCVEDPEDSFFALDGDQLVAHSRSGRRDEVTLMIEFSATAQAYRRRGISTAMKVVLMDQATGRGIGHIRTMNHEDNPILGLNRALGFERLDTCIEMGIKVHGPAGKGPTGG